MRIDSDAVEAEIARLAVLPGDEAGAQRCVLPAQRRRVLRHRRVRKGVTLRAVRPVHCPVEWLQNADRRARRPEQRQSVEQPAVRAPGRSREVAQQFDRHVPPCARLDTVDDVVRHLLDAREQLVALAPDRRQPPACRFRVRGRVPEFHRQGPRLALRLEPGHHLVEVLGLERGAVPRAGGEDFHPFDRCHSGLTASCSMWVGRARWRVAPWPAPQPGHRPRGTGARVWW